MLNRKSRHIRRLLAGLVLTALSPAARCDAQTIEPDVFDMPSAIEYCHGAPLASVEGIWEFPEDATRVLIRRRASEPRSYDLILISSPDCRLTPGETIGHMDETSDPSRFRLALFCDRRKGLLTDLRNCSAEFSDKNGSLRINGRKVKLSIRSVRFLPQFWRLIGISVKDPAAELPLGLIRIYPGQQKGTQRNPIYF